MDMVEPPIPLALAIGAKRVSLIGEFHSVVALTMIPPINRPCWRNKLAHVHSCMTRKYLSDTMVLVHMRASKPFVGGQLWRWVPSALVVNGDSATQLQWMTGQAKILHCPFGKQWLCLHRRPVATCVALSHKLRAIMSVVNAHAMMTMVALFIVLARVTLFEKEP